MNMLFALGCYGLLRCHAKSCCVCFCSYLFGMENSFSHFLMQSSQNRPVLCFPNFQFMENVSKNVLLSVGVRIKCVYICANLRNENGNNTIHLNAKSNGHFCCCCYSRTKIGYGKIALVKKMISSIIIIYPSMFVRFALDYRTSSE